VEQFVGIHEEDTMSFWDVALKTRQYRYREVVVAYRPADLDFADAEELIRNPPLTNQYQGVGRRG